MSKDTLKISGRTADLVAAIRNPNFQYDLRGGVARSLGVRPGQYVKVKGKLVSMKAIV